MNESKKTFIRIIKSRSTPNKILSEKSMYPKLNKDADGQYCIAFDTFTQSMCACVAIFRSKLVHSIFKIKSFIPKL